MKKSSTFNLRLSPEMKRDLEEIAKRMDRSVAWVARRFIEQGIEREKKQRKRKKK